jgi:hypothetical protein
MLSQWISLSSHLRGVPLVDEERAEVMEDAEGRQSKTREGRADQSDVRTEELGHATPAPFAA